MPNLWVLWNFCTKHVIIQRNTFLFNVWKQPQKGVRKTDRKTPVAELYLKSWNFTDNGLNHRRFPAEACQLSKMELFAKNIHGFGISGMFDWVLNMPLQTASHYNFLKKHNFLKKMKQLTYSLIKLIITPL